jgi:CheY-like chemotaxis protein/PAS domain-containing protein
MEEPGEGIALLKGELYANPRFLEILGWAAAATGDPCAPSDPAGPDAPDRSPDPGTRSVVDIARILGGGQARYETTGVRRDGTPSRIEVSVTPIPSPEPAFLICVRDITEQKRAEVERAMLESRLLRSVESFGEFAGKLSHDVGNSLMALMGYASLLKSGAGDEKLRRYAELVVNASETAAALVRGFANAGNQASSFAPSDLNDVARGAVAALLSDGAEISVKLAGERLVIAADVRQLQESIVCLAADLWECLPGPKHLRIETAPGGDITAPAGGIDAAGSAAAAAGPASAGPAGRACGTISITWVGTSGADSEDEGSAPAPLAATAPERSDSGKALRLSSAYGVLRRHGGRIAFPGAGLHIYLPLVTESGPAVKASPAQQAAPEKDQEILLLADDDPAVRGATAEVLRAHGYGVLEAADGEEAIQTFVDNKEIVKLLLLDMDMPKKSGKDVYEFLRRAHPGVKAVFITARARDAVAGRGAKDAKEAKDAPAAYIQKPVAPAVLLDKIREILG